MDAAGILPGAARESSRRFAYRAGIDENGLGASLGPLVVTAVMARVSQAGIRTLERWNAEKHAEVLNDSKKLIRHGDVRLGEAWARLLTGEAASHPQHLLEQISSVRLTKLQARCPKNAHRQCWNEKSDEFLANDEHLEQVRSELVALNEAGIQPIRVVSRFVCTSELNERMLAHENRFLVDLHSMEELIDELVETDHRPLAVVCGKVGSMSRYPQNLQRLGAHELQIVRESKEESHYRFEGLGSVKFVRDADATDPLVMLASLVGKYLRELFVSRIGGHFASRVRPLRRPSGYHDPVTAEFVRATEDYRLKSKFPATCFVRTGGRDS